MTSWEAEWQARMVRLKASVTRAALSAVGEELSAQPRATSTGQQRIPSVLSPFVSASAPLVQLGNKREFSPSGFYQSLVQGDEWQKRQRRWYAEQESAPASRRSSLASSPPGFPASSSGVITGESHRAPLPMPLSDRCAKGKDTEAASLLLGLSPVPSPKGPAPLSTALPEPLSSSASPSGEHHSILSDSAIPPALAPAQRYIDGDTCGPFPMSRATQDNSHLTGIPMVRSATSGLSVSGCLSLLDIPDSALVSRSSPLVAVPPLSAPPACAASHSTAADSTAQDWAAPDSSADTAASDGTAANSRPQCVDQELQVRGSQ